MDTQKLSCNIVSLEEYDRICGMLTIYLCRKSLVGEIIGANIQLSPRRSKSVFVCIYERRYELISV